MFSTSMTKLTNTAPRTIPRGYMQGLETRIGVTKQYAPVAERTKATACKAVKSGVRIPLGAPNNYRGIAKWDGGGF